MTTLSQAAFQIKLQDPNSVLIDLRTSEEQKTYGVISDNQIHIDVYQSNALESIQDLSKESCYLLYCWHGVRSKQVLNYMKSEGFQEVYDLEGGIDRWNSRQE